MSASREKRSRKEAPVNQAAQQQAAEKKAKFKKNLTIGIAIALVIVLIFGALVFFKGPYLRNNTVAVTVGSQELTPTQVHYYYVDEFTQFVGNFGEMAAYFFDDPSNIENQVYDEATGATWGDYVMQEAMLDIANEYAVYEEALANGYEMSEEAQATLDSTRDYINMYASMYGVDGDAYIRSIYGNASSVESYMEYQAVKTLAYYYQEDTKAALSYTEDDIRAEDEANPMEYNAYTYHSYLVSGYVDTEDEAEMAAAMEEARANAAAMAEATQGDLDAYLAYCDQLSETDAYTNELRSLRENYTGTMMTESVKAWVTDPARQEGDVGVVEISDTGCYVLYYVSQHDNNYEAPNARVIEISAKTTDESGNEVVDFSVAETKLDNLLADVAKHEADGDDVDGTYNNLAGIYSSNEDTRYNGGKYEFISKDEFEEDVTSWLFAEDRVAGDTTSIRGEDAIFYIYYEGIGGNYRDNLIIEELRERDFTTWYETLTADAEAAVQPQSGMKYVDRKLNVSIASSYT